MVLGLNTVSTDLICLEGALVRTISKLITLVSLLFAGLLGVTYAQETQRVLLEARLGQGLPVLTNGLEWRIFEEKTDSRGDHHMLLLSNGGSKAFDIEAGEYLVHASYGHAGVVRKITVGEAASREEFVLNAGGLRLTATASENTRIPKEMLSFDIYEQELGKDGRRKLLARSINAEETVVFPIGTYHVISKFGQLNATVRADIRVETGKMTQATLQHRAAIINFRLVRSAGGDAVANTSWSILAENGEVIKESTSTFPSMVLAEGNYTAIAKHEDTVYSEDFVVDPGLNKEVEVIAPPQ